MPEPIQILLEYREPDDYDIIFNENLFTPYEAATLMKFCGEDVQNELLRRGYIPGGTVQ